MLYEQERPTLRCLMALPGLLTRRSPRVLSGIDPFDPPRWSDADAEGVYRHRMVAISRDLLELRSHAI